MDSSNFIRDKKNSSSDLIKTVSLDPVADKIEKVVSGKEVEVDQKTGGHLRFILDQLQKTEKMRADKDMDLRLAFQVDPNDANYGIMSTYRQKTGLTPDQILKRIAGPQGDDLVNQILQARSNTMASFGRPRTNRFSVGFEFQQLHPEDQETPEHQRQVQKRIEKMKEVIWNCGSNHIANETWHPNLSQFLKMITRDGLTYGRFAVEFIYPKDGSDTCQAFRAVDAGTIYQIIPSASQDQQQRMAALKQLESLENLQFDIAKYEKDEYKWVQVINGNPVQVFSESELVVYNLFPVTNIEYNGYPLTPVDQALNAIITHISITLHNKLFFENGRAARGMLVFKSDDIDEAAIQKIRNQFHASINSVKNSWRMPVFGVGSEDDIQFQSLDSAGRDKEFQFLSDDTARVVLGAFQMSPEELPGYAHLSRGSNSQALSECFDPSTPIMTDVGLITAKDYLNGLKERLLQVWDGHTWQQARLFETGKKKLTETELECGLKIKTSPDHRFRCLDSNGNEIWKHQSDLQINDYVAVNSRPVDGYSYLIPSFGLPLTADMMEILGWALGDGSVSPARKRVGASVTLFYHQDKEVDIWSRHQSILNDFGIKFTAIDKKITKDQQEAIKDRYGFKSVAASRKKIKIYSTDFVKWLSEIGFYVNGKKRVPPVFHALPVEYRVSFLRGLYSADGHATKLGGVVLTIQDDEIRESIRQMLIGLGVRTTGCKGILRKSFGEKTFSNKLFLKDRNFFWENIGFLQAHKQSRRKTQKWSIGDVQKKFKHLSNDFYWEKVVNLIDFNTEISMVDVEVFNDKHAFILNGIQVHNSDNEYKLTAARDVGLRPLIYDMQDFMNTHVLPKFNEQFSKEFQLVFAGLEKDSPEKETTRLTQDMAVHMTMDDILKTVEKPVLGKELGGQFILNQQWQQSIAPYLTVGFIMEAFFGIKGAAQDPRYDYIRDPFYFQQMQLTIQKAQMAMQNQQMAMQMTMPQQPQQDPQAENGDQGPPQEDPQAENGDQGPPQEEQAQKNELAVTFAALNKSVETNHNAISRMILERHNKIVEKNLEVWKRESSNAVRKILGDIAGGKIVKSEEHDHSDCDHDHDSN